MEAAFSFVANAIGWASNRGVGERESSNTSTKNYNNLETNNQHVSTSNGYNNNNNTMSASDIASKSIVETNTKRNGVGATVGTTRRSRMFTASGISYTNDSDGTPGHNHHCTNNTKE